MNARYYVPSLGRFASADTKIPDPTNPQAFNRFSYTINNPLRYTDPDGHTFWDVVDGIFFAISAAQFAHNPTWANAGWLALDTVSALPVIPSLGYFRYGDEALQLYNRITDIVHRGGIEVGQNLWNAIKRFSDGNQTFPSGWHIGAQFINIAHIPGAEKLIQRLATINFPMVKGYTFALYFVAGRVDDVAEIERALGNGRSIDVVLNDGTFVELKNYNWELYSASEIQRSINDFLDQLHYYQQHSTQIEFVFKGSVPDVVRQALESNGAIVKVVD